MAFDFHSQAATKRKRETGFLSDDNDDDNDSNGNNIEDDGSIKNNKSQSLFADITTPPLQSRTRRRSVRSVDTKLRTKSNNETNNGSASKNNNNNKQFFIGKAPSSIRQHQYVMESTSSGSRSLIHHLSSNGGSMQTFKKKKKIQSLVQKKKQRPPPSSPSLRNSNELSQSPETIINDVEKIKDENGPTSFPKNKHNTIQSQSETSSRNIKNKSKNIQTKIDNDTIIVESPPNCTTSKHSNNTIIQQSPSQKLSRRSMENTHMKKKLSFTKQNGSKSKQATKIIPGNSLKATNNHNATQLPRTIHNIKNTRLDITTQQTLHNNRKSKRLGKMLCC